MTAFADDRKDRLNALLTSTLVDSLALNIELIEKILDLVPADERASPKFCATLERIETLKSVRSILLHEPQP